MEESLDARQDRLAEEWVRTAIIPELNGPRKWKGVKLLGSGAFGRVGLWESLRPDNTPEHIVIKENFSMEGQLQGMNYEIANPSGDVEDEDAAVPVDENENLDFEGQTQYVLTLANSQHILNLVREPVRVPIPGVEDRYRVARLFMEYSPLGTLKVLLQWRQAKQKQFAESTLWQFLDCLVDGLCVLAFGEEAKFDEQSQRWTASNVDENWFPICHSDLHTENVILSKFNDSHPITPVVKICDFGESKIHGINTITPGGFEGKGDATTSDLYQVGEIMFRFCQLDHEDDPNWKKNFTPQEEIKDWELKGVTSGLELSRTPYSKALKKIIFECLYDEPQLRPGLLDLKGRVQEGLKAAKAAHPGREPWDDFLAPEPESNVSDDESATEPGDSTSVASSARQKELQQMQEEGRAAERKAREETIETDELPRKKPPPSTGSMFGGSLFG